MYSPWLASEVMSINALSYTPNREINGGGKEKNFNRWVHLVTVLKDDVVLRFHMA